MNAAQAILYHNPRCSKSRQTLELLQARGIQPQVVDYLKNPPDAKTLREILGLLQLEPQALIRIKEPVYQTLELPPDGSEAQAWIDLMVSNPILIERPIVVIGNRAVIGRPPENVLSILP
ncbi:MAG TPA: arsenate reductase (glutaredoxin) [Gammaproteobacteria bacterium]|jgi:arsenate reductase